VAQCVSHFFAELVIVVDTMTMRARVWSEVSF